MSSGNSGVDSASCGFANNPFLQKMGKKKIIARHRSATVPSKPSTVTNTGKKSETQSIYRTQRSSTVLSKPIASDTSSSDTKPESKSKPKSKPQSKVAALSASLSNKGISYGQTRSNIKTKPFKSQTVTVTSVASTEYATETTFNKPLIQKRRPKTKKMINIDDDDDDDSEQLIQNESIENKDQIINELKQEIMKLKTAQNQATNIDDLIHENEVKYENKLKLKENEITILKQRIEEISTEHKAVKTENISLQRNIDELNETILELKQYISVKTEDDDIVIIESKEPKGAHDPLIGHVPYVDETLLDLDENKQEIKEILDTEETVDLRVDSNYKMIKTLTQTVNESMGNDETEVMERTRSDSKGLFDDLNDKDETMFGDRQELFHTEETPENEAKTTIFYNSATKEDKNEDNVERVKIEEKEDPLLSINDEIEDDYFLDKDDKKDEIMQKVTDIFDDNDEDDVFGFEKNKKRKHKIDEEQSKISSLFDSDSDNDDHLFNID